MGKRVGERKEKIKYLLNSPVLPENIRYLTQRLVALTVINIIYLPLCPLYVMFPSPFLLRVEAINGIINK